MKASRILKKARKLITNPKRWTQGASAKNKEGISVSAGGPLAKQWCAIGAIMKCNPIVVGTYDYALASDFFRRAVDSPSVSEFNDDHTHEEVLEAFDKAIELAKQDEG